MIDRLIQGETFNKQAVKPNSNNIKTLDKDRFSRIFNDRRTKQNYKAMDKAIDHNRDMKTVEKHKGLRKHLVKQEVNNNDENENETQDEIDIKMKMLVELLLNLNIPIELPQDGLQDLNLEGLDYRIYEINNALEELIIQNDLVINYDNIDSILGVASSLDQLTQVIKDEFELLKGWSKSFEDQGDEIEKILNLANAIVLENKESVIEDDSSIVQEQTEASTSNYDSYLIKDSKANDFESNFRIKDTDEKSSEDATKDTIIFQMDSRVPPEANATKQEEKLEDIDRKPILQQIVEKAKLTIHNDKQEIRIRLKPEILGELILKMKFEKGNLLAKILVDNYRTKDLLEANLYQLKDDMKDNGIDIKTFEVFVGNNEDFQRGNRQDFSHNRKQTKLRIINGGASEIKGYEDTSTSIIREANHEGRLDLFA